MSWREAASDAAGCSEMRNSALTSRRGVRLFHPVPSGRLRLVCLPHAGGAASYFRDWSKRLREGVELWAVQYPGRENRLGDPLPADMDSLVDDVTEGIRGLLDRPVVIFGHSMGALVGYEVAQRLTGAGEHDAVRRLVVSGSAAPHLARPYPGQENASLLSDEQLVQAVKRFGVDGLQLLDDADMRSVLLPAIRNDYRLVQSFIAEPRDVMDVEVTALVGREDSFVDAEEARAWSSVTNSQFSFRAFPGGHFYLTQFRDEVLHAALDSIEV